MSERNFGGTPPLERPSLSAPQTRLYSAMGVAFGLIFPIAATLLKLTQLQLPLTLQNLFMVQHNEILLWIIDTAPLFLGFAAGLAGGRQDILIATNSRLQARERELAAVKTNLEQRIKERTQELENRNFQMRTAASITSQMAYVQSPSELLSKTANLINQRFGYEQVSIFLLDEERRNAFLQASSSDEGKKLLEQGFHVAVNSASLVGRVIEQSKPIRAADRRGVEAAIPLIVRGKVNGAIHIQSEKEDSLSRDEIEVLQLLGDQIAALLDNIRLLGESQAIVSELEILTSQQMRAAWREYLQGQRIAYKFTPAGIQPLQSDTPLDAGDGLKIPLTLRGQQIGSITLRSRESSHWSEAERDLAEKIAAQVSLALDNSRLLGETRQRALQEQTVNEISARLSRSLDIDTLLQTAARELASLPEVAEASVVVGEVNQPASSGNRQEP
jgi:GAF domain-containing protein